MVEVIFILFLGYALLSSLVVVLRHKELDEQQKARRYICNYTKQYPLDTHKYL